MKKILAGILSGIIVAMSTAIPAFAIGLPSSTPSVVSINIYRNILQTGDYFALIEENTPYSSTPTTPYSSAYVWRLIDTDNVTELAQALGFTFNGNGYGYNVIGFYLDAGNFTAKGMTWGDADYLRLSGLPTAFASPPIYNFSIPVTAYNSAISTTTVMSDIAAQILTIAHDLDVRWGFTGTVNDLVAQTEAGEALSSYGESFFRGAVFGIQALAPAAFSLNIGNVNNSGYVPGAGGNAYTNNLSGQNTGNPIGNAEQGANAGIGVNYNLVGLILVLGMVVVLVAVHWYLTGGNVWRGLIESAAPVIICARLSVLGLGELSLFVAVCWLYISAKVWRLV